MLRVAGGGGGRCSAPLTSLASLSRHLDLTRLVGNHLTSLVTCLVTSLVGDHLLLSYNKIERCQTFVLIISSQNTWSIISSYLLVISI